MKTDIHFIQKPQSEYVSFHIYELNSTIEKLVQQVEQSAPYLLAQEPTKERMKKVYYHEILYIESVDKKSFLYTSDGVFLLKEKLFELEELLEAHDYVRISKSMILNIDSITAISPKTSGRFEAKLTNEEKVMISRFYIQALKEKLGLRRK
ncbi:LytTR family DNA-binding domain-containing protein [Bacillus pumilus]|uniref:LytTR family DNA-binding domain-containing protein n=1 Tax=Bacillus TaxID=1386 RepID=UPI00067FB08B|nr:LytTR family DNA-binding domain-containing protein [Bacillus pumilus]KMY19144.1 response regulator receiver protein [Bacillus pumilus]MCI4618966.1 LytTR family transcriptional regulator DNA-binding domain-containing protein [Bacillus pumilus]MDR0122643.1 LytTR family DNA-binding domain-containing protein [Bacillus pumilus]